MKHKFVVYGLIDPRDSSLFYIGKSCSGTKTIKRHTQARSLATENPVKAKRILDILRAGYKPKQIVLEYCTSKKDVAMRERVLIAKFRKEYYLTNIMLNKGWKCSI